MLWQFRIGPSDFTWICKLDRAKELFTGDTYINDKACLGFIKTVAANVIEGVSKRLERASFMSFIMDSSTDISGEEQECVFVRSARNGVVSTNFLQISHKQASRQSWTKVHPTIYKFQLVLFSSNVSANVISKYCCPYQAIYAPFKI